MLAFCVTVGIAISLTFLCSILEACILSTSATDIAKISEKKPKVAAAWKGLRDNIQRPIAVILIINTFAHTIGAALSGSQFNDLFGHRLVGLYSVVLTIVMIQWGEILPKTLAIQNKIFFIQVFSSPLTLLTRLLSPVLFMTHWLNRPFEGKKKAHTGETDALGDISVLAHFASLHNLISKEQEKIVSSGIRLSNRTVGEIMVRREDMKYLSTKMSLTDALLQAHIHHHTRFPLVDGDDADVIIGYVNFKDIVNVLRLNPKDPTLKGIARPIPAVKPGWKLSAILTELTKGYQHIAGVKDDAGKTVGLITLEDIVESIVGSLNDEYDMLPTFLYPITEDRFVAGGGVPLSEMREKVAPSMPESAMALNDWLMGQCKVKPKTEGRLNYRNLTFTVRKISRSKIHEVIVDVRPEAWGEKQGECGCEPIGRPSHDDR
jgi:CBS domain containing-hemolysin-like protein